VSSGSHSIPTVDVPPLTSKLYTYVVHYTASATRPIDLNIPVSIIRSNAIILRPALVLFSSFRQPETMVTFKSSIKHCAAFHRLECFTQFSIAARIKLTILVFEQVYKTLHLAHIQLTYLRH